MSSIITGRVTGSDPLRETYVVACPGHGTYAECVWAAPIALGIVGFNIRGRIPIGTSVELCTSGKPPYITGFVPESQDDQGDAANRANRSATFSLPNNDPWYKILESEPEADEDMPLYGKRSLPNDMLEGEFEIGNMMGAYLRFLTNIIQLSAGDRARIEVSMANDMVRVVAHQFERHTTLGEEAIFEDGRANRVRRFTSYEHESFGQKPGKPKVDTDDGNKVSTDHIEFEKRVLETGRWRYEEYTGFLGDFLHAFLSDPEDAVAKIGEDAFKTGKLQVHANMDGSFIMRSVSDIAFERVVRIAVPRHDKRHDDPEGVKKEDFDKLDKQYLKIWKWGKDPKKYPEAIYQLREYARWLSCYHSYARFIQVGEKGEEYTLPQEDEIDEPELTCREEDKENANKDVTFIEAYSCMRMMRNGGIVHLDSRSNSIVLPGHGGDEVQITSTKSMRLEAAADMRIIAGQGIQMKARRSIDISAIKGGIILRSWAWLKCLCEEGTIWLKGDASPGAQSGGGDDDPDSEVVEDTQGVVIETTRGDLALQSAGKLVIRNPTNLAGTDEAGNIFIEAEKDVRIKAKENFIVKITRNWLIKGKDCFTEFTNMWHQIRNRFQISEIFKVDQGKTETKQLIATNIRAKTIAAKKLPAGADQHTNHIAIGPKEAEIDPEDEGRAELEAKKLPSEVDVQETWKHEDKADAYDYPEEVYFESLSQQRARTDDDMSGDCEEWDFADDKLSGNRKRGAPWPGEGAKHKIYDGDEKQLHEPLDKPYKDLKTKGTQLTREAMKMQYHKRGGSYDDEES